MGKRIVVKIGTSTITHETGMLNLKSVAEISEVLSDLHNMGMEVIIVTSGAVGAGMPKLGLLGKKLTIPEKQAAAAVGQSELINIYRDNFARYGKVVAQLLLTRDAVDIPQLKFNVENTFNELLSHGAIPIVNENDSVEIEELEFGDNDTLSAYVAQFVSADLLVILSDIKGFYDKNPYESPDASLIPVVYEITEEIKSMAGGAKSGTGGMITKLAAAEIANAADIDMVIADGADPRILYRIASGQAVGTLFKATQKVRISPLE